MTHRHALAASLWIDNELATSESNAERTTPSCAAAITTYANGNGFFILQEGLLLFWAC